MRKVYPAIKDTILLAPSFALMSISTVSPALADIAAEFPEISNTAIQLLCTLPSLVGFPIIFLSGKLASIFTKKQISILSLFLMLLGGVMPVFFHASYTSLITAAVVYGVGFGGISPMTTALINEHCPPQKCAQMMGFQSAIIGLGGVVFSFLGGALAEIKWYYTYLAFLLIIPLLVLAFYLPKGIIASRAGERHNLINCKLFYYLGHAVLLNCFIGVFQTNISMLISERGFGGAKLSGGVTAFYSFSSIIGGIATGSFMKRLGRNALITITAISGMGMLVIWAGKDIRLLLVGTFLAGAMYAMRMPAGYTEAIRVVPVDDATMAISAYCCSAQFGNFLSPVAIGIISPVKTTAVNFLTAGLLLGLLTLCAFVTGKRMGTP